MKKIEIKFIKIIVVSYYNNINFTIKMSTNTTTMYSFNNIISATWEELAGKHFIRIDTNEELGTVYAKYDNMFSLANICTNGRIEFLQKDGSFVKQIFGKELDVNAELFKVL